MRGIAILSVVFFHAFSRWEDFETFSQSNFLRDFFSFGYLGVQLFFMISGYVIYMSMERKRGAFPFILSRWLRLAPAMLMGSIVILLTSNFIPQRPIGDLKITDLVPGMLFVEPGILNRVLGTSMKSLDGAFWSIYVEVKFYIIACFLFYVLKDLKMRIFLTLHLLYLITIILSSLVSESSILDTSYTYMTSFGFQYFGWFGIEIYSYKLHQSKEFSNIFILIFLTISNLFLGLRVNSNANLGFAMAILFACWFAPILSPTIRKVFEWKALLFFGFISYPLYLIHQNIVTGLAIQIYNYRGDIPAPFLPLFGLLPVVAVSFLIATTEPKIRKKLPYIGKMKFQWAQTGSNRRPTD